jgi:hypothetical protein
MINTWRDRYILPDFNTTNCIHVWKHVTALICKNMFYVSVKMPIF